MQARMLKLHHNTANKLLKLKRAAEQSSEYRGRREYMLYCLIMTVIVVEVLPSFCIVLDQ